MMNSWVMCGRRSGDSLKNETLRQPLSKLNKPNAYEKTDTYGDSFAGDQTP
jgi:hypothetical protein